MKEVSFADFTDSLSAPRSRRPLYGQLELTRRCPCRCLHCYCADARARELKPVFWKKIIDRVRTLGGLELTLTGGDPLCFPGFLEVYRHAKQKGFLVNVFTSGCRVSKKIMDCLEVYPPLALEVTLNSLDPDNYDRITQTKGMFETVMNNIQEFKRRGIPLVLKCNGLKENRHEILKIKRFAEALLGKGRFKFDSFIFPSLDGGSRPKAHRLEPEAIMAIESCDEEMTAERQQQFGHQPVWFNPEGLYHCNTWVNRYFINADGVLQFCHLTLECASDLKKEPFEKGFGRFGDVLAIKYKSDSKCVHCELKAYCHKCPARAFLETGDPEAPVDYYCRLARARKGRKLKPVARRSDTADLTIG